MTLPSDRPDTTTAREIVIRRVVNAPRTLVWKAFTTPEHLRQFWGPRGYTNPVCEMDVRPGGAWRQVMRAPDGTEIPTTFIYREVVEPERIVYTNNWEASGFGPAPGSLVTVTFEEQDGKTLITIRSLFRSAADRDATEAMGHITGMNESLDRLEAHLAGMQTAS